nr:hypothetical protein [Salinispora arenicola]
MLPLIEGRERGWPLWAWLCLAAALMLFAAFMVRERAVAGRRAAPLVHPGLFHDRAFSAGLLTQLFFYFGQASFFLVFAVYVQNAEDSARCRRASCSSPSAAATWPRR